MKKYFFKNKLLLCATIIAGAVYAVVSTLMAIILREIVDVAAAQDISAFFLVLIKTVIYLMILGISYLLYGVLSKKIIGKVIYSLRSDVFDGIFGKSIQNFKSVNSADYLSALTNDVKLAEDNCLIPLMLSLQNIVILITALVIMFYFSPIVMLCLLASMLLLFGVTHVFKGILQKRQNCFSNKLSRLTVVIKDFLSGFEIIRSYRMNNYVKKAFGIENLDTYKTKYSMDRIVASVDTVSSLLGLVVQFSVFFVSAYLIITEKITVGMLLALVQVTGSVIAPIQVLSQSIPKIQSTVPIIDRLKGFADSKDTNFLGHKTPSFCKQIAVRNLSFGYENSNRIIDGIDFVFERNKKYAVIGKSGCGKTTLINLLAGYYSGYEGEIRYDEHEMHELNIDKLNEMSAIIHQNVYMFDESIKNNICLHNQFSEQDLAYALNVSGVNKFLSDTKGLHMSVGENGSNFSGGQRQRIAVARALIQKKPILILDEGTSAVDMQTAYDIESQLLQMNSLTLITITHSLNSELLKSYDCIVFMENGQIREFGTFDELANAKAEFHAFCNVTQKNN